ncbi:MAG: cupin domain-containing protein, partial [Rhodanobacteraceae bacterium]
MSRIDIDALPRRTGSSYPAPFDQPCLSRVRRQLGDACGLTDFGVNLLELQPGAWSSQRHWHSAEDEFVWVLKGEVTLIDDQGELVMRAGDCAAFAKGDANGHHLVNRT